VPAALDELSGPYPSGRCKWCHHQLENLMREIQVMVCINPECSQLGKRATDYIKEFKIGSDDWR
jgi:hypothetical protein